MLLEMVMEMVEMMLQMEMLAEMEMLINKKLLYRYIEMLYIRVFIGFLTYYILWFYVY